MRLASLTTASLTLLLLTPAASRLQAAGTRQTPPAPPAAPAAPAPPEILELPDWDTADLPRTVRFHGRTSGGYLGVRSIEMTPELRQHFGAPRDAGVFVGSVEPESPASRAGLQVGDIITAVDGEAVGSTRELSRSVRHRKEGEKVQIDLFRDRAKKTLSVTVVERKGREPQLGDFGIGAHPFGWRGWNDDGRSLSPVPPVPPVPAVPSVPPVPPAPSRWGGLEDRLESLEQRLREIEGRLPKP